MTLTFDASKLDSNNPAVCALSMAANALGVGLSLPADGAALANVEVIVTSGKNFGSKVYFGADASPKRVTNGSGFVEIEGQGKARSKAVPSSAPEKNDEFGLNYAAQVEELTALSLLNVFVDGLSQAAGAIPAVIDIARTLHYDLGEFLYPFTDYDQGYKVTVSSLWDFPESGLGLTASFVDAELLPTGPNTYSGTIDVTWGVAGAIGEAGCGLVQEIDPGKAKLTGPKDGTGLITITVEYTSSPIRNVSTCGPASSESTINVTAGELSIVGDEAETLDDSLPQVLFSGPQTQEGTAQYTVVPGGD